MSLWQMFVSVTLGFFNLTGGAGFHGLSKAVAPPPPAHTLSIFSTTPLSVPPFGYFGTPQCDAAGRMFFKASVPPLGIGMVYLSISADGQRQSIYQLPKSLLKQRLDTLFYAASDGRFYILAHGPQIGIMWIRYETDGTVDKEVTLKTPANVFLDSFAVTPQGYLLLMAHHLIDGKQGTSEGAAYRAIFSPSGDVVKILPAGVSKSGQSGATPGLSGNRVTTDGETFYWLSNNEMTVMDTDGSVIASYVIAAPTPKADAEGLRVSGSMAEITFGADAGIGKPVQSSYLVVDALTGSPYGLYLPPAQSMNLACFSAKQGFTFLKYSSGRSSLVQALLP